MTVPIKIVPAKGNISTFKNIRSLASNFKTGVRLGFEQAGISLKKTIKEDLNDKEAKTGRVYLIPLEEQVLRNPGVLFSGMRGSVARHRASGPLQTAATFTGNYEDRLGLNRNGSDSMQFGDNAAYARELELGDRDDLQPRPSLGNTVEKEERNTENYLGHQVYKAVSKR